MMNYNLSCDICRKQYDASQLLKCEHKECDERIFCERCIQFVHSINDHNLQEVPVPLKSSADKYQILHTNPIKQIKANKVIDRPMICLSTSSFDTDTLSVSSISSLTSTSMVACEGLCKGTYSPNKLFICKHKDCINDRLIFCKSCGQCTHKWKSHAFLSRNEYIISVQELIAPDTTNFSSGKMDGSLLLRGTGPVENILWYTRWVGAITAHGTHMGGTFGTSMMVNGAPTASAACGVGHAVVGSALAVSVVGGVAGTVVGTLIEWAFIWNRYDHGIIKKHEAMALGKTALVANGLSTASFLGIMAVGAALGTPGGPVGWIIGSAIGAIIAGILTRLGINKWTEKHFKKKHVERSELQKEALDFFFHNENYDIKDERKFNQKIVRREYRRLATIYHPDRKDGDHSEWLRLSAFYGILTAMCERQDGDLHEKSNDGALKTITFDEYQQILPSFIKQNGDLNSLIFKNMKHDYFGDDSETITNAETFDFIDEKTIATDSVTEHSHLGTVSQESVCFSPPISKILYNN